MKNWDSKLLDALWAYRTAYKVIFKFTHFQLVYGQKKILAVELKLSSLFIAIDERLGEEESLQEKIALLERLDEIRNQAYLNIVCIQK